jgi:hypothetical protein
MIIPVYRDMSKFRYFILLIISIINSETSAQFLSHLQVTKTDALYTTYASSMERSHYKTDQGYQFQWFDDESGVEFISDDGPNLGIALQYNGRLIFRLQELYREPVITVSYSDLVKYFYFPVKDLRVEAFFVVYSSETAILNYRFVNESHFPVKFKALPYFYYPGADSGTMAEHQVYPEGFSFQIRKKRDSWMVEHNIPIREDLSGFFTTNLNFDSVSTFLLKTRDSRLSKTDGPISQLQNSFALKKSNISYINSLVGFRTIGLQPGESTSFRIIINLADKRCMIPADIELERLVKADEQIYAGIPNLFFTDKDREMLYWSTFSLMRQCMMPPEGECRHNYYVFSREPRWGWGYGGQVFHESLAMMAYAYMDPEGAMNSQRVFMERQEPDGYINYRTGPYLNETIETNGKLTTSAPWFNYENLEIYHITGDKKFLKEAYDSGKKFYQYYVANRDSNNNGLCEWGAHAELESVRDARVAIWDKVSRAFNFEGPDLNSMLVMEAKSLAAMAEQLGLSAEAKRWSDDAGNRSTLINKNMWDPETGFYYNVNKKDQSFSFYSPSDLKIKEIIGFLPLWAGVTDAEKAKLLVEKMMDTTEFWRPFGVPSLTAADDYFCPIGYWNGPVWVQWEYLLYRGLRDNGYHSEADQLAGRVVDNMIYHLKNDHVLWEFYSADDRQAGWNRSYFWAGVAARFLIDSKNTKKQQKQHSPIN